VFTKREQLGIQLSKMYRLLGKKSQLSIENKLYKTILKAIWAYGVQLWILWDTAANSDIEIPQIFQNEYLRIIVNAPWYVTNDTLHHDLNVHAHAIRYRD